LEQDIVLPIVAEVIGVDKAVANPFDDTVQRHAFSSITLRSWKSSSGSGTL
jgi:hypothetical protein